MKTRSNVIIIGFAVTFAIMFFGLLFGTLLYNYQTYNVNKELNDLKTRSQEIRFFSNYLQANLDINNCSKFDAGLIEFADYLNDYGRKLTKYYNNQRDLEIIKEVQKDAVIGYLELLVSIDKYNDVCSEHRKNYILYLYPYDCTTCDGIVTEIRSLTNENKGIFDVSIPAEIGLESVDFIKNYYDVNYLPSVVVNGVTLRGSESYPEIKEHLIDIDKRDINLEDLNSDSE